ncbi:MAG: PD40 domain-containing protein [Chloroflexi bacterium]|nr:PD40 domain-containing protein [Chloroflexota bacterium]
MRKSNAMTLALLLIVLVSMLLNATACGAATPTPLPTPVSPTLPIVTQPTAVRPIATALPPTIAPLPTVGAPTPAITPTVAATATRTVVRTATRPAASPSPATPRPGALSGRIAYSVVTDPAPRLHTIWAAKGDGTGATKLIDGASWPALSPDGKYLAFFYLPGSGFNEGLYVGDAFGGKPLAGFVNPGVCCINWSRDSVWIVFVVSGRPNQPGGPISMVKNDGAFRTIVDLKVIGSGPSFSADSKQIVFSGCVPGTSTCGLLVASADGTGATRIVTRDNGGNAQWSPRGDKLVYQARDGANNNQVFVVNPDGSGKKQLTNGKSNDGQPTWSRDGGSIYWRSDQNGTSWAIMVMNADGTNARRLIPDVAPDPIFWGWEGLSVGP